MGPVDWARRAAQWVRTAIGRPQLSAPISRPPVSAHRTTGWARWTRWSRSRKAGSIAVVAVVLAIVSGVLLQGERIGTSGGGSPAPPGSPAEDDWARVQVPDLPAVADLAPTQRDATGIRPETTFTLASLTREAAADIAKRLETTPSMRLQVTPGDGGSHAILQPEQRLEPGQVYRFALRAADGRLQGSWSFRVRSPLHVLSTIPGDRTTDVPTNRAVELTFDQDGAADMATYFSISPSVTGRFERHGRTQVFVPDRLAAGTLYTVTLRAGLPRAGTDLRLERDVVLRFETGSGSAAPGGFHFGRDAIESSPREAPVLGIVWSGPSGPRPTSIDVVAYRYPDQAAAARAYAEFLLAPRWTTYARPVLATGGLPVVASFAAPLQQASQETDRTFHFPAPLPAGWYAIELTGPPRAYAFLQVTGVSAWTAVLTDRTVVWVNDVATGAPVNGATVSTLGGAPFATSDSRGLAVAATPDALIPPAEANGRSVPDSPPLLVVRAPNGASLLLAFEVPFDPSIYRGEWWEQYASADATYWSLLYTDRQLYRRTDRIEAWGYLRGRDGGAVPGNVSLELVAADDAPDDPASPALVRAMARPSATGAYPATVAYDRLPYGWYVLRAVVGGRIVSRTYLEIGAIRKPAYRLTLASDRTAIFAGEAVHLGISATFFDGSPVPDLAVHLRSGGGDTLATGATDARGARQVALTPAVQAGDGTSIGSDWGVEVVPNGPEEGEISAPLEVVVFPSADYIAASGTVRTGRLVVSGSVHAVDLDSINRERAAGTWDGDPAGAPIAGRPVRAQITRLHQVRTQVGTYYDSIEKVVQPIYNYDTQRVALKAVTTTSRSDGSFALTVPVPSTTDTYEVRFTSTDAAGRTELRTINAGTEVRSWGPSAQFVTTRDEDPGQATYAVGQRVAWRIVEGGAAPKATPATRYLYVVAQRGLVDVATSASPTFSRTFGASDAPGIFVMGVRFTGSGYAPKAASWAVFNAATRALTVRVTADRAAYRPGDLATLTVRVTDAAGRPKAADVLLQAVDEKLFAVGAAVTPDPLHSLYARTDSGIVRLTASHQGPTLGGAEGEGGAAGGSPRTDFRDTLASRLVRTGASGVVTTAVHLSDDLTSWHVVASAVTGSLETGVGERLLPVGLPLFADMTLADEYLVADRPSIRLRAYGGALKSGDPIVFTVQAPSLGLGATEIDGTAFSDALFTLPALTAGRHQIDVAVSAPTRRGADGKPLTDRLIRSVDVVTSRVTTRDAWYGVVGDRLPAIDSPDVATYTLTDASSGRYLPLLLESSEGTSARIDRAIARDLALKLLADRFGMDPRSLPQADLDLERYPVASGEQEPGSSPGIPLLPDAGADPWLAARIVALAPGSLPASQARAVLETIRDGAETPRDLRIASLAGLAAIEATAEPDLRSALALPDLSPTERLYLAIGFLRLGDEASARAVELGLLREYGQQLGAWVRVRIGGSAVSSDATGEATALLAVVAAGLGDPLAPAMIEYVRAVPSHETSTALELVAAAGLALDRAPRAAAALAYTVEGVRREVTIGPGQSFTLTLIPAQRRTLRLDRLSGAVGLAVSWRSPADIAGTKRDRTLSLARTLPASPIPATAVVTIDLKARLASGALTAGCYEVVEQVPSGLAPIAGAWTTSEAKVIWPTSVVGQEVRFCVALGTESSGQFTLRYAARVVNAGTFAWEPATMQHDTATESFTATSAGAVTIAAR